MPKYYIDKEYFKIVPASEVKPYIDGASDNETQVLIALVWLSGLRLTEILRLKKDNFIIDNDSKTVTITTATLKFGKTAYPSFSFDDPFINSIVMPYINQLGRPNLFTQGKRIFQKRLKKLNETIHPSETEKWLTFHYFRHSRITFLARILGASPEELKSWTGHRSSAFEEYFRSRKVERFRGKIR